MASTTEYRKASKYPDYERVYRECSGPGGLKIAEFIAEKISLEAGSRLLDIGMNGGYQTCFIAKEYGVFAVGIDPGNDPVNRPETANVERLMDNARSWGVANRVLGIQVGVPESRFARDCFDAAYSTTTFEMIRGFDGEKKYRECLSEVLRVLRPGGHFGYGDPMCLDVDIPPDVEPLVAKGPACWVDCVVTVDKTVEAFKAVGFEVMEADYVPDANTLWEEYAQYDQGCQANPDDDPKIIRVNAGRWLSLGYVIARKPD